MAKILLSLTCSIQGGPHVATPLKFLIDLFLRQPYTNVGLCNSCISVLEKVIIIDYRLLWSMSNTCFCWLLQETMIAESDWRVSQKY